MTLPDRHGDDHVSLFQKCAAASLGALFFGLGDLITNGDAATIVKMSEVLGRFLFPILDNAAFSLFLLIALGALLAWVYEPRTRLDAFARGLSVFAMLSVATPYDQVSSGLDGVAGSQQGRVVEHGEVQTAALPPVGWAFAAEAGEQESIPSSEKAADRALEIGRVTIRLRSRDPGKVLDGADVTIRDIETGQKLGSERIAGSVVSFSRPLGSYLVEVESPYFKRVHFTVEITSGEGDFSLSIPTSRVPLAFQRLLSPAEETLVRTVQTDEAWEKPPNVRQPISLAWVSDSLIVLESNRRLLRVRAEAQTETLVENFGAFRPLDMAAAMVNGEEVILVSLRAGAFNKLMVLTDGVRHDQVLPRFGLFTALAMDPNQGIAYLADGEDGEIYSLDLSSGSKANPRYEVSVRGARSLDALTFDPSENRLFVADALTGDLFEIQLASQTVRRVADGLRDPAALVYLPSLKQLLIAESARGRIASFGPDGTLGVFVESESLRTPRGLAVDPGINIWVADRWTSDIKCFSEAGNPCASVGGG